MRKTDPNDDRVAAAHLLIQRLARELSDPDNPLHGVALDTAVVGFGATVRQHGKIVNRLVNDDGTISTPNPTIWTPLDADHLPEIDADIESYRGSSSGRATDYWTAMDWVTQVVSPHDVPKEGPACHLVLWFTDGGYYVNNRFNGWDDGRWDDVGDSQVTPWTKSGVSRVYSRDESVQVQKDGQDDLCRPGGVADQLRHSNVTLAAIALDDGKADFTLLKRIATNITGDCGDLPGRGLFATADPSELAFRFDRLADPNGTVLGVQQTPVCMLSVCPQYAQSFVLDASLRKIHLVGVTSVSGLVVQIDGPSGFSAQLAATDGALGELQAQSTDGIEMTYDWVTDRLLSVDLAAETASGEEDNWSGTWTVTFIDPTGEHEDALASTQMTLSAGLAVVVPTDLELRAGDAAVIPLELTTLNGTPTEVGSPAPDLRVTVQIASRSTPSDVVTLLNNADFLTLPNGDVQWDVPVDFPQGDAVVRTTLVPTTSSGLRLSGVVRQRGVTVQPMPGTPSVTTSLVELGTIEGTQSASGTVDLVGPGCVWVTSGELTAHPRALTSMTLDSSATAPSNCVQLADGEHSSLDLSMSPDHQSNGDATGTIVVHLAPRDHPDRAGQKLVTYQVTLIREAQDAVLWIVFAVALLIGIGLPVFVLWLTRRMAARYPADALLQSVRLPVSVSMEKCGGAHGSELVLPPTSSWDTVPPPTDGRRTISPSGVLLQARSGALWSSEPGYSQATDGLGISGTEPYFHPKTLLARLPLAVHGTWLLLFNDSDEVRAAREQDAVTGEVLFVVGTMTDEAQRHELLRVFLRDGPSRYRAWRAAVQAAKPAEVSDSDDGVPDDDDDPPWGWGV